MKQNRDALRFQKTLKRTARLLTSNQQIVTNQGFQKTYYISIQLNFFDFDDSQICSPLKLQDCVVSLLKALISNLLMVASKYLGSNFIRYFSKSQNTSVLLHTERGYCLFSIVKQYKVCKDYIFADQSTTSNV